MDHILEMKMSNRFNVNQSINSVVVFGRSGQLAKELVETTPQNIKLTCAGRADLDITNKEKVVEFLNDLKPDWVINTAAYTAVDRAESEPDIAYALNQNAVKTIALACKAQNIPLVHLSTDFVFCNRDNKIRKVTDQTLCEGIYSSSKLAGEKEVLKYLPDTGFIVRTSWLYSTFGSNFVKTMINLMKSKKALKVVNDQFGSPTYAKGLAFFLWKLIEARPKQPIYHWSDEGQVNWFEFAQQIGFISHELGILHEAPDITGISGKDYGAPAPRPSFSPLDCSDSSQIFTQIPWQKNLRTMIAKLI